MTDSDQNSSNASQKQGTTTGGAEKQNQKILVGTSERKANKNGIKQGTFQKASHKQHKQHR